jgi:ATP-dependent exoDNAse (exonuclease V) alpha subunit
MKYLKTFESHSKSIGKEVDIKDTIKNLHKISKEQKDIAISLLNSYTKAGKGKITGLELHPDLKNKIKEGGYPSGYDMGIDKDGYFIHTHRARSKSHEKPSGITAKEMKFIDSTG